MAVIDGREDGGAGNRSDQSGEAKLDVGTLQGATTKRQKDAKDAAQAKVFAKIIRRSRWPPTKGAANRRQRGLRPHYTKVRDASVPIDTIERAIKRGSGELEVPATSPSPTRGTPTPGWP